MSDVKPSLDDWQKLAAKELKGRTAEDLTWQTPEGIAVKPLYTAADLEDLEEDVQVVQVTIGDEEEEVEPEFMVESFDEIEVEDELDVDALIEAAKHDEELV